MSKAHFSAWHNYNFPYTTEYHKVFYDYFVENFPKWCDLVDSVYLVDVSWNFTEEEKKRLTDIKKEVYFIKVKSGFLDDYLVEVVNQIKEEEILFMDNDCFIYDRLGVKRWFDALDGHETSITFSGGSNIPPPIIFKRFPKLVGIKDEIGNLVCNVWLNHFLFKKSWFTQFKDLDFEEYHPFPVGTYISELDYTTKEGDYGEYACRFIWKLMGSDWVEMPLTPDMGFRHFHSATYGYLLLQWVHGGRTEQYQTFIKEQPKDKFFYIMSLYYAIDTKKKYEKEVIKIIKDLGYEKPLSFEEIKKDIKTF